MTSILRDIRYGLRIWLKSPGPMLTAVMTLGLGIGLTSVMFSVVKGIVLSRLPFEEADRLVYVATFDLRRHEVSQAVSPRDYIDWKRRQQAFEGLAAFRQGTFNLSGDGNPERLSGAALTANALALLRVRPLYGRGFSPGDDVPGAAEVVLLGYELWQHRFAGDPQIIGQVVRLNGRPATVVGIMPRGFLFPVHEQIWTPLRLPPEGESRSQGAPAVDVFGRLRADVSLQQAQIRMQTIAEAARAEHPDSSPHLGAVVGPYTEKYVNAQAAALLLIMLGIVCLVLLLACANVANLLMARAAMRIHELTLRSLLGAGRLIVIRQLLIEGAVLAALGALPGLMLTAAGVKVFDTWIAPSKPPFWFDASLDLRSLSFLLAVSLVAGLLSGLVPAIQMSRTNINEILAESRGSTSRRSSRFAAMVVAFEIALSFAFLVETGLLLKALFQVQTLDFGAPSETLLTASFALDPARYPGPAERSAFAEELMSRLPGLPGVISGALTEALPTDGSRYVSYAAEGSSGVGERDLARAHRVAVSPGFFAIFGRRILAGRDFGPQDHAGGPPVVIANESLARTAWPRRDPIGRRIQVNVAGRRALYTVVGVVPDLQMNGLDSSDRPDGFYVPISQDGPAQLKLAIKAGVPPLALAPILRQQVAQLESDLPLYDVQTFDRVIARNALGFHLFGALFGVFGFFALVLASVGLYSVIALSVQQRTREIGVRMALGARGEDILALLLRQAGRQLAIGLGAGLVLAWVIAHAMSGALFQVEPGDPLVFLGVALALSAVALLAGLLPARRAMRLDPQWAIRYE